VIKKINVVKKLTHIRKFYESVVQYSFKLQYLMIE